MIDTDKCEHILYGTKFNPIDVYNVAEELLAEVKRLRSIADDLYAYIVSDADISLRIIEEQMDWREEE